MTNIFKTIQILAILLFVSTLSSCKFGDADEVVFTKGPNGRFGGKLPDNSFTNVTLENDQIKIFGNALDEVVSVKIQGGPSGLDNTLDIVSQTAGEIVLSAGAALDIALNTTLTLLVSTAQASTPVPVIFNLVDGSITAEKLSDMGAANGEVLVYNSSTLAWEPQPLSGMNYIGSWNADTNNPALSDDGFNTSPNTGDFYVVSDSGSTLIDGEGTWNSGDWIIFNGLDWERVANAGGVTTFNGRTGAITPATNDYTWNQIDKTTSSIGDITDIDLTGLADGKILKYDSATSKFIVDDDLSGGGAGSVTSSEISDDSIVNADINASAAIDYSKLNIADDDLTIAKTNGLQTALDAKLPLTGGTLSGDLDLGANNLVTSGTVDGVDVSALGAAATANATNIATNSTNIASKVDQTTTVNGNALTSNITLDTDDVAEGSTNEYFTLGRARAAAVLNSTAGSETDQAPSVASIKTYIGTQIAGSGDFKADGTVPMTGNLDLGNNNLRLKDNDGTDNYVSLRSPTTLAADYTLTLPVADGINGQVLSTNGLGVLSWITGDDSSDKLPLAGGSLTGDLVVGANDITGTGGITSGSLTTTDLTVDTNTLFVDSINNRVGVGTIAPTVKLDIVGSLNSTEDVQVDGDFVLKDNDGADNFVSITAPLGLGADYTLTLPVDDGTTGQILSTNGSGILGWVSGADASSDKLPLSGGSMTGNILMGANDITFSSSRGIVSAVGDTREANFVLRDLTNGDMSLQASDGGSVDRNILLNAAGGNVAIGKTSAASKLDVSGTIRADEICDETGANCVDLSTGDSDSSNKLPLAGGTMAGDIAMGTNDITGAGAITSTDLTVDTDTLFVDSVNNRVGIGIISPNYKLTVDGSITAKEGGAIGFGNLGQIFRGISTEQISTGRALYIHNSVSGNADPYVIFSSSAGVGSETMRIDLATRNVGIGTVSPDSELDVSGTIRANEICDETGANCVDLSTGNSDSSNKLPLAGGTMAGDIAMGANDITGAGLITSTDLTVDTNTLHVDSVNNRVGVGTTSPSSLLDLGTIKIGESTDITVGSDILFKSQGLVAAESNMLFTIDSDNNSTGNSFIFGKDSNTSAATPLFTIEESGNVGIGTSNPTNTLDIGEACCAGLNIGLNNFTFLGSMQSSASSVFGYNMKADITNQAIVANTHGSAGFSGIVADSGGLEFHTSAGAVTAGDTAFNVGMKVDPNGNVGIGTSTPLTKAHVFGGSLSVQPATFHGVATNSYDAVDVWSNLFSPNQDSGISIHAQSSSGYAASSSRFAQKFSSAGSSRTAIDHITRNHTTGAVISDVEAVSILSSGNVGIGTTNPNAGLSVRRDDGNILMSLLGTGGNARLYFRTRATGESQIQSQNGADLRFGVGVDDYITIKDSGRVGIGTTSPDEKLHVNGNLKVEGTVTTCTLGTGSGATNCTSDKRLKENVKPITSAISKIQKIKGVEFDWNKKSGREGIHSIGVIAQDVEAVFPTLVIEDKKTTYKMVDYAALVAPLIEATKEQQESIEKNLEMSQVLAGKITHLYDRVETNERKIASLEKENKEMKEFLCSKYPKAPFCKK